MMKEKAQSSVSISESFPEIAICELRHFFPFGKIYIT